MKTIAAGKRLGALVSGAGPEVIRRSRLRVATGLANAAWGQISALLCALTGIKIYTEVLAAAEFGYAMLAMGIVAFLDGVVVMAFHQTLLVLCGDTDDRKRQETIAAGLGLSLVKTIWAVVGAAAAAIAVVSFVLPPVKVVCGWLLVALIYLTCECLKVSMQSPLVANRLYFKYSVAIATESAGVLVVTTLGLTLVKATATLYIVCFVVGKALSLPVLLFGHYGGEYFRNVDPGPATEARRRALALAWPISLMAPLGWASSYLDRYVLSAVGGASLTGKYSASVALAARPYALLTAILTSYFRPRLYVPGAGDSVAVARSETLRAWTMTAGTLGAVGALTFLIGGSRIASWTLGREYRGDVTFLLFVIGASQTFTIMTHAADNTMMSAGAGSVLLRAQCALALTLLLLIPAIAILGARGAVLGRCAAECIKFCYTLTMARRTLKARRLAGDPARAVSTCA